MDFFELKNIAERGMELVNPTTPEKILRVGEVASMHPGTKVIDFGCGFGEALRLWGEHFLISGVGIDLRPKACERAQQKMAAHELSDRIEIVCMDAARYSYEPHSFDVAACIGATFIWEGFRPTLQQLRKAIHENGSLIIGQTHWQTSQVPMEYAHSEEWVPAEFELFQIARDEGFEIVYVLHSSHEDWDRYEAENWHGLAQWIAENPNHPDRDQVIQHLHESQDEYARYEREFLGWGLYVLRLAGH